MSNFIKLTSIIINTQTIKNINIITKNSSYCINLTHQKLDGIILFTSGYITSIDYKIDICKQKDPLDYKIITDWIDKLQ